MAPRVFLPMPMMRPRRTLSSERIFVGAGQPVKFLYFDVDFLKIMIINKRRGVVLDASGEI
jgi:hypothetical protein